MGASAAARAALVLAAAAFFLVAASRSAAGAAGLPRFAEAPEYRNGDGCPARVAGAGVCDPSLVHISMTLDAHYLRGSMAAIYSLLKHASCPESLFFHFVAAEGGSAPPVAELRAAAPLNYARNFLADLLPRCVPRTIYLDSDVLAVDDVRRLWETRLPAAAVVAAPEYCHANFSRYFTEAFWSDPELGDRVFNGRRRAPCYFNTGVMVIDLRRWRLGNYRRRIELWMEMQKEKRIYELGSLPPFLLVFAGEVEAVDHRWNQHGLGGDNVLGSCRPLHKGPVSLMHWSGKGKPWDRLDAGRPCPLDHTWKSYDLYIGENNSASAPSRSALSSSAIPAAVFSW
ncbi:hypothetical protein PR202_gb09768 [Eleusine coracana subsp. coracana]|uniref:Hexosyltransferase n=1 Tax=Eleusine coracana subsp. coracana TaxID=191504 RepID=A0AAV5EHW7_ELECO|nr:hypothetical protein PR202_gb09768 [Eleusine coracana subsp. coracana]